MLILLTTLAACRSGSPEAVVDRFIEAQNAHDLEAVLTLLTDDFVFRDPESTFEVSRSDVRPLFEWDAATRWQGEASIVRTDGDTIRVRLVETNQFLERLGLGPMSHDVTYVVADGRLRQIVASFDPALQQSVDSAVAPVLEWARETRPERLEGLIGPDGTIVYDGRSASGWLALLRDARQAGVIE